jgi:hypothetical protein
VAHGPASAQGTFQHRAGDPDPIVEAVFPQGSAGYLVRISVTAPSPTESVHLTGDAHLRGVPVLRSQRTAHYVPRPSITISDIDNR